MVTIHDVRALAETLPRSYEVLVGGRVKFRVGRIVYLSFSKDQAVMGFAFPKEQREWLIGGSPEKFMHPIASDMRYQWVLARLAALEHREMRELVIDAWRMVVPKSVASAYDENQQEDSA
ncbi:MAG TPA: MmcQ/YjbR family DNA-binding protein [Candidatus Dormibacteraeota bacterium]